MEYVALARHTPESCPASNAKVRERVEQGVPKLPEVGRKHQVNLRSAHVLAPTHMMVMILDAPSIEAVRSFIGETGISQWNDTELYPSQTIQEAMEGPTPPPIW